MKNFIEARVVSMPNLGLFVNQQQAYKDQVFPKGYRVMALEFSNDANLYRFVNNENDVINVKKYLKSGSSEELLKDSELDLTSLVIRIKNSL